MHRAAVVLGFVHPVVLLPAEMDQDANEGEAEHVLRHELAHVDRRDDWWNLAQQLIQAQVDITQSLSIVAVRDEAGVFSMVLRVRKRYR